MVPVIAHGGLGCVTGAQCDLFSWGFKNPGGAPGPMAMKSSSTWLINKSLVFLQYILPLEEAIYFFIH